MKKLLIASAVILASLFSLQLLRQSSERVEPSLGEMRIVSLSPNLTELVYALGAEDDLIGVTRFCTYPPEAQQKEIVGDFLSPNLEEILSLAPGLILAESWESSRVVPRLRGLGLTVVEFHSPRSIREIQELIREMGEALGREAEAARLNHEFSNRLQRLHETGAQWAHRPRLYLEIDLPSWTVGAPSYTHEALELAGAENIFGDIQRPSLQVSHEMVIARDPEVILSFQAGPSDFQARAGWNRIRAVRENRVISDLDGSLLSRGNHRLLDGVELLQRRLRELFPPVEP